MGKLVLVDAYSQIYRLFYAIRVLNDSEGRPVNALYGMAHLLLQFEELFPSELGAIVFDKGKPVKRVAICPEYKAQRPPMPDNLRSQLDDIVAWMEAFGWPILMQPGLEADDIIAAIARRRGEHAVSIITHDKDITQLTVDDGVVIMMPEGGEKWKRMDAAATREKFGVGPELLGDYLALVGDTADNIEGIPGIGPKTASSLLNEWGPLERILAEPEIVSNKRLAAKLHENRALLERNRQLVALDDELPDGFCFDESLKRRSPDWCRIKELAQAKGFKSLMKTIDAHLNKAVQGMFDF